MTDRGPRGTEKQYMDVKNATWSNLDFNKFCERMTSLFVSSNASEKAIQAAMSYQFDKDGIVIVVINPLCARSYNKKLVEKNPRLLI